MRKIDAGMMFAILTAAVFMSVRPDIRGFTDVLPSHAAGAAWYLGIAALVIGSLRWISTARGPTGRRAALCRTTAYTITLLMAGIAGSRASLLRYDLQSDQHWPPRFSDNQINRLNAIAPSERATWAADVALHRLVTTPSDPFTVPRGWLFPSDTRVAMQHTASGATEVWARAVSGERACVAEPAFSHDRSCDPASVPPPAAAFHALDLVDDDVPSEDSSMVGATWAQYRHDADHTARVRLSDRAASSWTRSIHGPIRATASVVGDNVMVGAHGTGALEVMDLKTGGVRWSTRVPNWIHMDIVSDGHVVAVGFGDNNLSFVGRAPSGVSVYDLRTGGLRWTGFDESSVMTSPLLHDSVMVYATSLGVLRKRRLLDGKVLAVDTLPGGAVMAPPAMRGDTIAFSLEPNHVCAVRFSTLHTMWCRTLDGMRDMGHAAPAIHDGMVIVSGLVGIRALSLDDLRVVPWRQQLRLAFAAVFPGAVKVHAGQRFFGFRLRDGMPVWQSPLFSDPRPVDGHIAGTASASDSAAVIVLPIADVLVGFNPNTGRIRWRVPAHGARGPALLANGRVVISGRDGVIEVRAILDGALQCTIKNTVGYDRAGPALVGGQIVLANLNGSVEVLPAADILDCRSHAAIRHADSAHAPASLPPHGD